MPYITVDGVRIYYESHGTGAETIVFSHGLLFSGKMFAAQVDAFKDNYRVITYDHRGQGQTDVTADGYDMDTLSEDAAALMRELDLAPCHFVGLSMGGFVAMRLAARHPELLKSIILLETSADPEPAENVPRYKRLNLVARWLGMGLVAKPVMKIVFGETFMNDDSRRDERDFWRAELTSNHRIGITRAVLGIVNRKGIYDELVRIKIPVLVVVGEEDVATVPAKAERIHAAIPGSKFLKIPRAGHSSSIEAPDAINAAIKDFLDSLA